MIRMDGCFRLHSKVVRFWETCRSAPSSVRHPQAPENNPGTFHLLPKPGIFTVQIRSPSLALRASRSSRRHRKHVAQDMSAVHRSFLLIERNRRHADSPRGEIRCGSADITSAIGGGAGCRPSHQTGIKIIRVTQRQPAEILQQVTIAKPETLQAPRHGRLVQTLLAQSSNGTSPRPFHVITLVTLTTMPETRSLSTLVRMTGLTLPTPG